MKIILSTASPDTLIRETLILGLLSDERPPRGFSGLVDWRLNGLISSEIAHGRILGNYLEKTACAFPERIHVSRLLLFGLGSLPELTYDRLYNAGFEMARTASQMGATDLALPMPAAGRGTLPLAGMTEALVTGFYDGYAPEPEKRMILDLEIPTGPDHQPDTLRGLERFRQQAGTAGIEIRVSEQTGNRSEASLRRDPPEIKRDSRI